MQTFRLSLAILLVIGTPIFARADAVDGVEAVVGDQAITYGEVVDYTRPAEAALRRQYAAQPDVYQEKLDAAMHDSLEVLVERQLILHNYNSGDYTKLPDSYVDQLVQDRIRERFDNDRVSFIKTLQGEGLTLEQFRNQVRDQFIESALRHENVQKEIVVSPYKVETYYRTHLNDFKVDDQVKLRMIVLTKGSPNDTSTMELAHEISRQIEEGAKFSDMAAIYSQGSQQHPGGDWGWVERPVLRKELSDVAFTLVPGKVSAPIDTPDSVYLILAEEKKPAHAKSISEVRDQIEKTLQAQQQADLEKQWIDGLKKKTFVRYFQ